MCDTLVFGPPWPTSLPSPEVSSGETFLAF